MEAANSEDRRWTSVNYRKTMILIEMRKYMYMYMYMCKASLPVTSG